MLTTPLYSIPEHLLLKVTKKMHNVCISRLKRTCSSMDSFVKENHRRLEFKTKIGFVLRIIVDESLPTGSEIIAIKSGKRTTLEAFELTHHGISISHLSIVATEAFRGLFQSFIETIRRIHPICGSAEINGLSAKFIVELTGCIECFGEVKINHYSGDVKESLRILGTAPNCSQFSVKSSSRGYTTEGLFDLVRRFNSFDGCSFTPGSFNRLLWDIHNANDSENLNWLFCSLDVNADDISHSFPFSNLPIPSLKILWDSNLVSVDRPVPRYAPNCIRRLDLRTKCALIVERIHGLCVDEDVFFVESDPSFVLDVLLRELSITVTESVRNEYLNGTEEEKLRILHINI